MPDIKVKTKWQHLTVLLGVQLPLSEYILRPNSPRAGYCTYLWLTHSLQLQIAY